MPARLWLIFGISGLNLFLLAGQDSWELHLANALGELLFTSTSADPDHLRNHAWTIGRHTFVCHIPANLLAPGRYQISVTHPFGGWDTAHENILSFTVTEQNSVTALDGRAGKIAPQLDWTRD